MFMYVVFCFCGEGRADWRIREKDFFVCFLMFFWFCWRFVFGVGVFWGLGFGELGWGGGPLAVSALGSSSSV